MLRSPLFLCLYAASAIGFFHTSQTLAADDYGVVSSLGTDFEVKSPAVTDYKGHKMLYMSGNNGIYFSAGSNRGWTTPTLSFSKKDYMVKDPAIVKHPTLNQYYMFYTMRKSQPIERVVIDRRTGKKVIKKEQPKNGIGLAYATACKQSPDGSGLCWKDITPEKPMIRDEGKMRGGQAPSAFLQGSKIMLYYKTNAPQSRLVRSVVDIRDRRIEETKVLTFQSYDPILKKWDNANVTMQAGISDIDVKPYGKKSYLMVGNDGSLSSINRWKSDNGLNFYSDPYDSGVPILTGQGSSVISPYLEPVNKYQFNIYYAYADKNNECSRIRLQNGSRQLCSRAIQVRLMGEEKDPKIFENDFFDKDFKAPDYKAVQPSGDDLYHAYLEAKKKKRGRNQKITYQELLPEPIHKVTPYYETKAWQKIISRVPEKQRPPNPE